MPPVLDRTEALERLEGDMELWKEICAIWIEDSGNMLAAVRAALDSRSGDGLRRAAHAMKGASANVGVVRVAAKAGEIELSAPDGDWDRQESLFRELSQEAQSAKAALSEA